MQMRTFAIVAVLGAVADRHASLSSVCSTTGWTASVTSKLTRLAAETGRTADQVALDLLASSIDHDEWFRAEVEKGRAAAREGRLIEHDDVAARMDRRYRG